MIRSIILKELQQYLLTKRFLFSFAIILFVMLGSMSVQIIDYQDSMLDYQANQTGARELVKEAGWWWPLQWRGVRVVRPILPTRILVSGTETNPDATAQIFDRGRPLIRPIGSIDRNPLLAIFPAVDLRFITGIILSLIVLVLSYDIITSEREDGTLKLLLSFPVSRASLIFAKWVGGYIILCTPFLVGALSIAIWIQLTPIVVFTLSEWLVFLGIVLASLIYIAWIFSASLAISTICRRSSTAMCVLLTAWVVLILIIPNFSPYLASSLHRVNSQQSIRFQSFKLTKPFQIEEQKGLETLRKKYGANRWWQHPESWIQGVDLVTDINNRQRRATRALVDERNAQMNRQTELANAIGRISPYTCFSHIVTTLSWTGPEFDQHLRQLMRKYEDRIRKVVSDGMKNDITFEISRIPFFNYHPLSLGHRFEQTLIDWILLLVGAIVFFLIAFSCFVSRDVI